MLRFFIVFLSVICGCQSPDQVGSDVAGVQSLDDAALARLSPAYLDCATSGATPSEAILVGATTGNTVAKYVCTAHGADIQVERIELDNCVTNAPDLNADCADPGETPGSDAAADAVTITYGDASGFVDTNTTFLASGKAVFAGLNAYFANGVPTTISVSVDTGSVGASGAASGDQLQMNWNTRRHHSHFRAVGLGHGLAVRRPNDYLLANPMTVRATKPTFSLASGSPSGAAVPGLGEVLRFNVTADSHGDVSFEHVMFKISTTDNDATGWANCDVTGLGDIDGSGEPTQWKIYNIDDLTTPVEVPLGWSFYDRSLTTCASGQAITYAAFDLAEDIPAGSTNTYLLKIDTIGASSVSDDAIRVDIPSQDEVDAIVPGFPVVEWDDGASMAFYIDGNLIKNLPINGGTLVF